MRVAILDENDRAINFAVVANVDELEGVRTAPAEDSGNIGDLWDGEVFVPPEPPPPAVPAAVTRFQARKKLLLAGLLDAVEPAINAIPDAMQRRLAMIEWQDAQEFMRQRPLVVAIGAALGLSSAELDTLFIEASAL
jgi:hypothetical protein